MSDSSSAPKEASTPPPDLQEAIEQRITLDRTQSTGWWALNDGQVEERASELAHALRHRWPEIDSLDNVAARVEELANLPECLRRFITELGLTLTSLVIEKGR